MTAETAPPSPRTTVLRRGNDVVFREVGDSLFLSHGAAGKLFRLNPLAAGFWRAIETPQPLDAILDLFAAAFPDVAPATLDGDIRKIVDDLAEQGLIVLSRSG